MTYTITHTLENKANDIDSLKKSVCIAFGVEISLLNDKSRQQHIKYARWALFLLLRSKGYTLTQIGAIMNRDHTSVINGLNKFPKDVQNIPYVKRAWNKVKDL